MKVLWTEQALSRLVEIEEFVASKNPAAATQLMARLVKRGDALAHFPGRGRRVPELSGSPLRELVERNYRIVYRQRPGAVEILTVFEAHRLLPGDDLTQAGP